MVILYCELSLAHSRAQSCGATNTTKLHRLQRFAKNTKARRFASLTKSRAFNEYFFAPDKQGGKWHKRRMERMLSSR